MTPNKPSLAIATGQVASAPKPCSDNRAVCFTLRNADAVIFVKLPAPLAPRLQKGDSVSVVGHLASFHNRCGSQLFLQAAIVLTAPFPDLWADIGVPAMLRTIAALAREAAP